MDRKDFFQVLFQNRQTLTSGMTTLNPYTGPWTEQHAVHLLRRTTFGFSPDQLPTFLAGGMDAAVDKILTINEPEPSPPINVYSSAQLPDPDVPYGQTWVNAPYNVALPPEYYQARTDVLKAWWTGLMIHSNLHIREKMTLFWHNHFAVEADTVTLAQGMYYYLAALRSNCLGNFKALTKTVTLDPAMLLYLNGYLNAKLQPDENYGRELQELFTVGKGPDSKFTEGDVKAAARVLTGYRINPLTSPFSYFFDFTQHDTGNKTFSAFYNNTVIGGKFGPAGANELDDMLNMIFATNEVALHLCRKIYQFFVYYEITPEVEMNIIVPMAQIFRSSNYEILPVMDALLRSEHFYDEISMGCIIKSPLDFTVGISRQFKVPYPSATPDAQLLYRTWGITTSYAAAAGLNVLDPPLVAGWPAWYQSPMFHRVWINSDTLASRFILANGITGNGLDIEGTILKLDPIPFADTLPDPVDPNTLVSDSIRYLFALPVSQATRDYYKSFLLGGLDDSYWSTLWVTYKANPSDPGNANGVRTRLSAMYREMMVQAEFHLS